MAPSPAKPLGASHNRVSTSMSNREGKSSGASAAAHGQVAHLVEEHRALQRIHLRDVRCKFSQKRVAQNRCSLFMLAAARVTKQIANVDFERSGQPCQR